MLVIGDYLQNRYRLVSHLGRGGMGTVFEAWDERFDISVALKEVTIDLSKIPDLKQQSMVERAFEREAKTLAKLHHEAFPHVIDYFSERGKQFLVMELVQGEDLAERLNSRHKPFTLEEVLNWTHQLLDALDYLHTQEPPIIHRDLKPQNLKLTARGKIKLLDFGIAKGLDAKAAHTTITNQTFVAATLNYSPVEQLLRVLDPTFQEVIIHQYEEKISYFLNQQADARSDLYSLGATLYHFLTASVPTDALKRVLDIWSGKRDPLPNPSELNPEIPAEISAFLLKALESERDNRFSSAAEMHRELQRAISEWKARLAAEAEQVRQAQQERLIKERQDAAEREILRLEEKRKEQERLKIEEEQKRQAARAELLKLEEERSRLEAELREHERLKVEAEQARQAEILEQQKRQEAWRRQEESEKQQQQQEQEEAGRQSRLSEQYAAETVRLPAALFPQATEENCQPPTSHASVEFTKTSFLKGILPPEETRKETAAPEAKKESAAANEAPLLPMLENAVQASGSHRSFSWILPAAALLFLLCGGLLAMWMFRQMNAPASPQTDANHSIQTNSNGESVENPPPDSLPKQADNVPSASNSDSSETTAASKPTSGKTTGKPQKNAPVAAQQKIDKAPKPTVRRGKQAITVDDIINDNP